MKIIESKNPVNSSIRELMYSAVFKYHDTWYLRYTSVSPSYDWGSGKKPEFYYGINLKTGFPGISEEESNEKPDIIAESIAINF